MLENITSLILLLNNKYLDVLYSNEGLIQLSINYFKPMHIGTTVVIHF